MQILDRRQQRQREAAGGLRGMDIVDAEDAEFAALEGTVSRKVREEDSGSDEEPRLAAMLGQPEVDKETEEAWGCSEGACAARRNGRWMRRLMRSRSGSEPCALVEWRMSSGGVFP